MRVGEEANDKPPPAPAETGADGLMIEVHPDPDHALSDGAQSLYPEQFVELMDQVAIIAEAIGRKVAPGLEVPA